VGNDPVDGLDAFGLEGVGGDVVKLLLLPPPNIPKEWNSSGARCTASLPRVSVPLPQCSPLSSVIWGKSLRMPEGCPPRHFIGAPTPEPKIVLPRDFTAAEAYRYNSFLMTFGASGLCDSPTGFRLARINMQLLNHAAAIPSQSQVQGLLELGATALQRIGRCGQNLPRFPCTGPAPCFIEGAVVARTLPPLRQQYIDEVIGLADLGLASRGAGADAQATARLLSAERDVLKLKYRALSPPEKVAEWEARAMERWGNPLGPTPDQLRAAGKCWEDIIESAARPGGSDVGF